MSAIAHLVLIKPPQSVREMVLPVKGRDVIGIVACTLLAIFLFGVGTRSFAQSFVLHAEVLPTDPTTNDIVFVHLSGQYQRAYYTPDITVGRGTITIQFIANGLPGPMPADDTFEIGRLAAGQYQLNVVESLGPIAAPIPFSVTQGLAGAVPVPTISPIFGMAICVMLAVLGSLLIRRRVAR